MINPKQHGEPYPDKDLAGVGIAYKIAEALFRNVQPSITSLQLSDLLDLVALGTVADLAPLVGENRSLVRKGLKQIRETKRQGLFALANVAELAILKVNATSIGFVLGPRLNASGRLESALASLELLTTTDVFRAGQLAQQLDVQNRQRQGLTRQTQEQAERIVGPALPLELTITDQDSMLAERKISLEREVQLQARVSLSGSPAAKPGDWQSAPVNVPLSSAGTVELILDQQVE